MQTIFHLGKLHVQKFWNEKSIKNIDPKLIQKMKFFPCGLTYYFFNVHIKFLDHFFDC